MRYILGARSPQVYLRNILLAAIGVGLVLRFVRLGGQSLWVDEVITLKNSFVGSTLAFSGFLSTLQGPLVAFIMHFWASLSSNDAFLRIPFAVVGCLTVLGLYLLARSLVDSWTTLHTVFVASLSPILIWYSQEIRGYAFAVLFSILMTYAFIQWLARPTARNAVYYGILLFAGLVSNLSALFVCCAHLLYLLLIASKRKLVGRWIVTVFAVLLVFSPWVREIIVRTHPEKALERPAEPLLGGGGLSAWTVPYSLFTYSVGYTLGPSIRAIQSDKAAAVRDNAGWIIAAVLGFGIPLTVGIVRLGRTDRNLLALLLVWLLVPLLGVTVLAARNVKVFNVRYALVAVPAYVMLLGQGLATLSRTRFWPFIGLFAAVVGLSIFNYFDNPLYGKEDMRAAARVIRMDFRPGDVVVGIYTAEALEYYLRGIASVATFGAGDLQSRETMIVRSQALTQGAGRVWLSLCRERMVDPRGYVKGWFDGNLRLARSQELPGLHLYLYEKGSE